MASLCMCSTYRPYVGLQSIWSCSIIKQHQNEVFLWFIHWRAILKSYRPILSEQLRRLLCTAIEQSSLEQSFTSYYISVTLTSSLISLGAAEVVLGRCTLILGEDGSPVPLSPVTHDRLVLEVGIYRAF